MLESILGKSHPDVASSYNNMGQVLAAQRQFDNAMVVYRAAEAIFRDTFGENHPHVASCRFNMGLVFLTQGKETEARSEFDAAHTIWLGALGPEHPHTAAAEEYMKQCSSSS